jgi:glycosyltransferase involved in cell wall biosynthesis
VVRSSLPRLASAHVNVGFSLLTLFPGRVGGSESYVRGLLAQFAAGNGPDQVTVLANRQVAAAYQGLARGPVRLEQVSSYPAGEGLSTRALAMAYARLAPRRTARDVPRDLDLVHYAVTVPIPATGRPTVVTVHDVSHLDLRGPATLPLRLYRRWSYDGAARNADLVIATSRFARARIVDGMGVAPDRVEVVPLGIDHETFTSRPADADRLSGLDLPPRFVLYPANLWPHKNHRRLVEAMARLADRELALVLAGQAYGAGRRLAEWTHAAGVSARVRHVGHVDPATLAAMYHRALAVILPSLHEGFGFPALEAMACGCPVASSGRGALEEVSGAAALTFDPEDAESIAAAVGRICTDQALRDRLTRAGLELAAGYRWDACARRHVELYSRVAG